MEYRDEAVELNFTVDYDIWPNLSIVTKGKNVFREGTSEDAPSPQTNSKHMARAITDILSKSVKTHKATADVLCVLKLNVSLNLLGGAGVADRLRHAPSSHIHPSE